MEKLLVIGIVGLAAQLVDGALGMAYGVTSTTLLLTAGVTPALASASVHLAELGTTLASGVAHWRFGNVSWRTVGLMSVPGFIGAFLGAMVLTSLSAEVAEPWVAVLLFGLGLYILLRFARAPKRRTGAQRPLKAAFLSPLGLGAGFLDAAGGGGWGPVGTPALLASGRLEPRKVVGSVDTAEFLVALGASVGFLISLSFAEINFAWVLALLAGGLVAAPLAAWLVRRLPARVLGSAVGGLILVTNLRTFSEAVGVEGLGLAAGYVVLTGVWGTAIALSVIAVRREARTPAAPAV